MGLKLVIAGGSGFIGQHITDLLLKNGHETGFEFEFPVLSLALDDLL